MPPPRTTATDLLAAIAGGDKEALKSLYDAHAARLFGIAMAILRDRPSASDALQEAFVEVWRRAGQFDHGDADAWLAAIVRHAALDVARGRGREAANDQYALGDAAVDPDALEAIAPDGARLRAGLQRLEPGLRQCIVLAYVHGLSDAELAAWLNEPPGAVRASIRRGLAELRERLA